MKVTVSQMEVTLGRDGRRRRSRARVADGYNLVGVTYDPPLITIQGPLELLQAIRFVPTEADRL